MEMLDLLANGGEVGRTPFETWAIGMSAGENKKVAGAEAEAERLETPLS